MPRCLWPGCVQQLALTAAGRQCQTDMTGLPLLVVNGRRTLSVLLKRKMQAMPTVKASWRATMPNTCRQYKQHWHEAGNNHTVLSWHV